jgi:hypothetical protein
LAVFYQFPQIALIFLVVFKTSILAVASEQVAFNVNRIFRLYKTQKCQNKT